MRAAGGKAHPVGATRRHRQLARRAQCAERRRARSPPASRSASICAAIQKGLASFPASRIACSRSAAKTANVLFVNDSKATNADSAAKALASFDDIFWIAGGKPKTGGITSLAEFFPRIRKAYLIGEAAQEFAETLDGKVPYEIVGDAVGGGRRRRARRRGLGPEGAGGAAVAGLRLVRPVPEFRGARKGVHRPGAGDAGGRSRDCHHRADAKRS